MDSTGEGIAITPSTPANKFAKASLSLGLQFELLNTSVDGSTQAEEFSLTTLEAKTFGACTVE